MKDHPRLEHVHVFRASARRRPVIDAAARWASGLVSLLALGACGTSDATSVRSPDATTLRSQLTGEQLFSLPFPGAKNERSCATCHVPEDNFTLTPTRVARLLETNPNDPLFDAIDADDPTAETLTFEHLKKGLVRVGLSVPGNMDLLDEAGNVNTPADRQLFVWRGVPSIADTAMTAPFQLDGRVATLEDQAQGAITGHSQGGLAPRSELERIAAYERGVFSSERARSAAEYLAGGGALVNAPQVEDQLDLTPTELRGREVYGVVCAPCHGGGNQATIINRDVHDLAFPALERDGRVSFEVPATDPPTARLAAQPDNEFLNIGSAYEMVLAQLDTESEVYTRDLSFPRYRYRFYTDASRMQIVADLPPLAPAFDPEPEAGPDAEPGAGDAGGAGDPGGPGPAAELDGNGNPIIGPNFALQPFSVDPGRAVTTGTPYDFEAFDVPTLRGIGKTAPYFHNNAAETLERVVQVYSDHMLSKFPSLTLPGEREPDPDGDPGPPEALTADQKSDLVAFLKRL